MNRSSSIPKKWTRVALMILFVAVMLIPPRPSLAIDAQRFKAAARQAGPAKNQRQPAARIRTGPQRILPHPMPRWTLGVRVDNLQTGVRITEVTPSSAAWRVGLERRDAIVSINGYQIGFVYRQLYELSTELNLRADGNGWVRLLVWNHRNGELVNVDVALDRGRMPVPTPRKRGIQGQVAINSPISVGKRGEIVVQLVDITDRLKKGVVKTQQRIPFTGATPVAFHLDIAPDELVANRRYELRSNLTINGKRVLASRPGSYVLNRMAAGRKIEIALMPIRFDKRR